MVELHLRRGLGADRVPVELDGLPQVRDVENRELRPQRPALVGGVLPDSEQEAGGDRVEGELALDAAALARIREALRADRNLTLDTPAGRVFVEVFSPPRRCSHRMVSATPAANSPTVMAPNGFTPTE